MDDKQLVGFINDMMRTDLDCLDCTEVNDVLARYVDLEVEGSALEDVSPEMAEHIKACPPCADMHATLLEVARLEAEGSLSHTEALWADVAQLVDRRDARRANKRTIAGLSLPVLVGAVATAAAMLFLFVGLRDAQEAAENNRIALDMIDKMDHSQTIELEDGAWARFYFSPDMPEAVVAVGALPNLEEGQYLECWLKRAADGAMMSAGTMDFGGLNSSQHWTIEAGTPIEEYSTFIITVEPQSQPLFEVPLTQDS